MIGRRAVVGLSLLCALVFGALAAQGAMAAGTTAFTCAPSTIHGAGFSDEHCTNAVSTGAAFEHVEIAPGTPTNITVTNEKTGPETKSAVSSVLSAKVAGATTTITCKKVSGTGTLTNNAGPPMSISGTGVIKYTECVVTGPKNCTVKEPIEAKTKDHSVISGTEMWLEFEASATNFTEITFQGESCSLNGDTLAVTGTVKATPNGATLNFVEGEGALKLGVENAKFSGSYTLRMEGGNPISVTTTAS